MFEHRICPFLRTIFDRAMLRFGVPVNFFCAFSHLNETEH